MTMTVKNLTVGDFLVDQQSALYNTDTIEVTAPAGGVTILPGHPVTATGVSATNPLGVAIESVTIAANEKYHVGVIRRGHGVVLNRSRLEKRYPALYTSACITSLQNLGFVFK